MGKVCFGRLYAHDLPVFFVVHLYVILIVSCFHKRDLARALSQQTLKSDGEVEDVSPAVKDTQEYRLLAGKKYFAAVDKYDINSWRDPHSMFDVDDISSVYDVKLARDSKKHEQHAHSEGPSSGTGEAKCPNQPQAKADKCKVNEYVYITRWLKKFLKRMNYSPDMDMNHMQIAQLYVSNRDLHVISKLLDSKEQKDVMSIDDVLSSFDEKFYILPPESVSLTDVLHFIKDNSVLVFTVLACIVSLWYLHVLYHNGLTIKLILILVGLASFIWTWIHMYQKEIAKKEATLHSLGYPKECQQNELGYFGRLVVYWQRKLVEVEDNCLKYYEAQLVDPFWKVSPLMVASETASNFVLQPLGAIATHSNIFIKQLFGDLPLTLTLPTMFFGFLLLLMLFRYRLRLPFFFVSLEPNSETTNRVQSLPFASSDQHAISNTSRSQVQPSIGETGCCGSGSSDQHNAISNTSRSQVQPSIGETGCCGSGDCLQAAPCDYIQQADADSRFIEELQLSTEDETSHHLLDSKNKSQNSGIVLSGTSISSDATK